MAGCDEAPAEQGAEEEPLNSLSFLVEGLHASTQARVAGETVNEIYLGKIVGVLVVRYPVRRRGVDSWKARCRACHSEMVLAISELSTGNCPSCRRPKA